MIAYSIKAAAESKLLDRTVVSTNSETIATIARCYGADVPFIRPAEFATAECRIELALIHALAYCEEEEGELYDCVVLLQNSSPLRQGLDIDGCVGLLLHNWTDADSAATAHLVKYSHMLRWYDENSYGMYPLKGHFEEIYRRQDAPPLYMINGLVFVVKREYLLGEGRVLSFNCIPYILPKWRAMDVDAVEDMKLAEALLK